MIKVGDHIKIVSLYKQDAYFRDGIAGSRGIVQEIEEVFKTGNNGINYYAGYILITDISKTCRYKYELDTPFYFAYAQLRKVRK